MDESLRNRVSAIAKEARQLGEALHVGGWSPNASEAARLLKRQHPPGPLASELAGTRYVVKPVAGSELKVRQSVEGPPVDPIAAILVSEIRPLLDRLITPEEQRNRELKRRAKWGAKDLYTPLPGLDRREAEEIGSRLIRLSYMLSQRIGAAPPSLPTTPAHGASPDASTVFLVTLGEVVPPAKPVYASSPGGRNTPSQRSVDEGKPGEQDPTEVMDEWLTVTEAAEQSGLHKGWVSRLCTQSKVASKVVGRHRFVDVNSLARYMVRQRRSRQEDMDETNESVERKMRQAGLS